MDGDKLKPSLASLALGLMRQIAPAAFDGLGAEAREHVLRALGQIDVEAASRLREAIKTAAPPLAPPAGTEPPLAFEVPAEDIDEADAMREAAHELALEADRRDATSGPGGGDAGGAAARQALALSSLACSALEACILLRAIAGALEIRKGE